MAQNYEFLHSLTDRYKKICQSVARKSKSYQVMENYRETRQCVLHFESQIFDKCCRKIVDKACQKNHEILPLGHSEKLKILSVRR